MQQRLEMQQQIEDCQILNGNENSKQEMQDTINLRLHEGYDLIHFSTVPMEYEVHLAHCLYTAVMVRAVGSEESEEMKKATKRDR